MSVRAFLLVACILPLSGCVAGVVGAAGAVSVAAVQDRTLGQSLDDANASNELKARLLAAGPRRYNEVDVEVAGRVALLTGRVETIEDRMEVERIAWTVGLIEDVANEIQVREAGGVRQNLNDEWITARVRTRLFTDQEVKSVNINIETYDGVVYLMGIARSSDELRQIAEHASVVNGVREVVSYIQIREPNSASPDREQNSGNNDRYDPDSGLLGGPSS
ncbi:BON domain-containing protein [Ponticaulis sp.]|uniref:BON domain-containing protein n=1 Tax=Ponticaulis sp. TaxID=2020902 RepID=UPI00261CC605|nr:BON domain-containing protein [Ponticaulis sp.]MDF1679815.1 BON domain-containing protein [Ponticaulis sp.]